jgi:hypothetical protein
MPMAGQKIDHTFQIRDYHLSFLKEMMEKYRIPNEAKALRVLLDYAVGEGDLELIFHRKNVRCYACHS